jgi:hypothetical protein
MSVPGNFLSPEHLPLKRFIILSVFFFVMGSSLFATDLVSTNESDALQREKLFQRFLKEMREDAAKAPSNEDLSLIVSNLDTPSFREEFFRTMVVHPSFGYRWDEVPAPTMSGSNAMKAVDAFVATNGWDMQKDGGIFSVISPDKSKPIRGLPWKEIHEREFSGVTYNGILYIWFTGFHHDSDGVAYNPRTNSFALGIAGFKPIGQHWYVWAQTDPPANLPKIYEGSKK